MNILFSVFLCIVSVGCDAAASAGSGSDRLTEEYSDRRPFAALVPPILSLKPKPVYPDPPEEMSEDERLCYLAQQNPASRYVGLVEHHNPTVLGCVPADRLGYSVLFGASTVFIKNHGEYGVCFTAAHIFGPFTSDTGKLDLPHEVTVTLSGKEYPVKHIYIHPGYSTDLDSKYYFENDITILILGNDEKIPLPDLPLVDDSKLIDSERCLQIGFGHSYEEGVCGLAYGRNDSVARAQELFLDSVVSLDGVDNTHYLFDDKLKDDAYLTPPKYPKRSHNGMSGGGIFSTKGELIALCSQEDRDPEPTYLDNIIDNFDEGFSRFSMALGINTSILQQYRSKQLKLVGAGVKYYFESEWAQNILKGLEG